MIVSSTRFLQQLQVGRMQKLSEDIARAQTQVSTRKRLLAPSDDPIAAARIAQLARQQDDSTAYASNVATAANLAARADVALDSTQTSINRAKELMLQAASGTPSQEDRASIVIELRSIATELQSLADSKDLNGKPLFTSKPTALAIPVGDGATVAPVGTKAEVFGSVVTSSGTLDISTIVNNAANALELTDPAARQAAADASLNDLDAASNHIIEQRSVQGLRAQRLDLLTDRFESAKASLEEERSGFEDTDLTEALAHIQATQVTLEAAQAIYSKLNQRTLFDLLG